MKTFVFFHNLMEINDIYSENQTESLRKTGQSLSDQILIKQILVKCSHVLGEHRRYS